MASSKELAGLLYQLQAEYMDLAKDLNYAIPDLKNAASEASYVFSGTNTSAYNNFEDAMLRAIRCVDEALSEIHRAHVEIDDYRARWV